ncbi:hypothetical protein F1654_07620 [Alkalicaulis satelles]|uniref:Uncharacterized protein n=1 Tax=Alkalicaulis satelles TaxID=2609175 RepID=A0A5M6ZMZ4_9PROT|nr:hypothetical protein [Alkalicaulis satelles]KAA5803661.1 hypothetical protein F1654_07620 [Alkalicaulis satelles]
MTGRTSHFGACAALGVVCLALAACSEGNAPRQAEAGEDRYAVYHLTSLTALHGDLHVSPGAGVFIEFGRAEAVIACEADAMMCQEWPFVFAWPERGAPPSGGWSAGGYEFRIAGQGPRSFCGRTREAYLVEGANEAGWATRVWYHPDFGVYAVMSGQAEDGELVTVERAYTTCDRGLYARSNRGWWPF